MSKNRKLIVAIAALLAVAAIMLFAWQVVTLRKAHSTFDNYYAFRGCVQLLATTSDSGTCRTGSGQTIKIVLYEGRWYLDGDLPQCFISLPGGTCLVDWP